ncbi:ABC transporter permease [Halomarina litorea]|uniref:ABC transporter permease n=1 Tax=Halomarina litorea TaxID=2961595 RepID=UPI0020C2B8A7|nr:ABC transporter permease [Halomarina sp. BCD28]
MSVAERVPAPSLTLPGAALLTAVACWWAATVTFALPAYVLPSPVAVAARLLDSPGLYATNALATARRVLLGGSVGVLVGASLAVLVVHVPVARRALVPYLVAARVLPKIAVAPVLLIYLGTGATTGLVFVALVTFFPMVVSTVAGLERPPATHHDLFDSVDAGPLRTFLHLRVPHALPDAFAGLKQATTLAVVGSVVAEWVVSTEGLGALILFALEDVQTDVLLAALVVLFALGLALYGLVALLERHVLWAYGHARRSRA